MRGEERREMRERERGRDGEREREREEGREVKHSFIKLTVT